MRRKKESEVEQENEPSLETAYFAGGCFWGVEYFLQKVSGVQSVISGYMGGHVSNPTYEQVCGKKTGHVEAVEVIFNSHQTSFETLCKVFFETHDPAQANGQGPDVGPQYLSVIFTTNDEQKKVAEKLITLLEEKGLKIATQIKPVGKGVEKFWPAEDYHQNYYFNNGKQPYCHVYTQRF